MKFRKVVPVTIIIAALVITTFSRPKAQRQNQVQKVPYKLIDLRIFDARQSYVNVPELTVSHAALWSQA